MQHPFVRRSQHRLVGCNRVAPLPQRLLQSLRGGRWLPGGTAAFLIFRLCFSVGYAQHVTEPSLKAAFIYHFAKFTVWPPESLPPAAPFNACVLGDNAVFQALESTVRDRAVSGHAVVVREVQLETGFRLCQLLYLSAIPPPRVAAILAAVRNSAILTIGDVDDFARQGGIAHIFVENGRMRFDLNFAMAKQARLQISSKLLVLGAHVFDGPQATANRR